MQFNTTGFNPGDDQTQPSTPKRVAIPVDNKVFYQSLEDFRIKMEALNQEFQVIFQSHVKILFDAVPDLEAIGIVQYTPYFNDGDTCEFGISSVSFYNEEDFSHDYDSDFASPQEQQSLKDLLKIFIYSNEDLMKSLYGDHAQITLTREETTIEEYVHD